MNIQSLITYFSITLSLAASAANAQTSNQICVAQSNESVSFVSFMNYTVHCADGTSFETKNIFTMVFIPIPYNWVKTARGILYTEMNKKGYTTPETSKIYLDQFPFGSRHAPQSILIFTQKKEKLSNFCSVYKMNIKQSGIQGKGTTFDANIVCNPSKGKSRILNGITQSELDSEMTSIGYTKVLQYEEPEEEALQIFAQQ